MKTLREIISEDGVAANAAGSGNIAGIGVGAQGEPGMGKRAHKKHKVKNRKRRIIGYGYIR
jgi:hypothetical protein